jgi:hypothetical protein
LVDLLHFPEPLPNGRHGLASCTIGLKKSKKRWAHRARRPRLKKINRAVR